MIPDGFAREWEAAWNAHDLNRIMAHYAEDIVFRSSKAVSLVGTGELVGQDALRDYWGKALERQPELKFTVTQVFYGADMLVLAYTNHVGRKAVETLRFDSTDKVVEASACHTPKDTP